MFGAGASSREAVSEVCDAPSSSRLARPTLRAPGVRGMDSSDLQGVMQGIDYGEEEGHVE